MLENIIQIIKEDEAIPESSKKVLLEELKKRKKELRRKLFKASRLEVDYEINKRFLNTSVQELEQKNQLLEKYVESNLQLENFAHIASHDLKAPLNNILSFSKLLQKTSASKLNPSEEKFVQFIIEAARNMRQTIQALLQFSIVTNKKVQISSIDVKELIANLRQDLKTALSKRKACLSVHELPDTIYGDASLIREVFQNLILNGIKFTKEARPSIEIASSETSTHWIFSVKDNGIGIAKEYQEKIFVMLQRLNDKKEYEGTGMGLSICRKIVESHAGEMWVESAIEEGSTFYFSISKSAKEDIPNREVEMVIGS